MYGCCKDAKKLANLRRFFARREQLACGSAGFDVEPLGTDAQDALTNLDGYPPPFPAFANHLRRSAAGELSPIPADLPKELHGILEQIHQAIRQSG